MKRVILLTLLACGAAASAAMLDGIAARVDSRVITVGDVMAEIRRHPDAGERIAGGDQTEMQALYKAAHCFEKLGQSGRADSMRTTLKKTYASSPWAAK